MVRLTQSQLSLVCSEISLPSKRRVVLLDVGGRDDLPAHEHNQNIYCIEEDATVVWQIQRIAAKPERDSFVSLSVNDKGEICADKFFGNEYVLDPNTGLATSTGWHK